MKVLPDGTAVLDNPFANVTPRFSVKTKSFKSLLDGVKVNFSTAGATLPVIIYGKENTNSDKASLELVQSFHKAIVRDATATAAVGSWGPLPTLANYIEMDELYDVDEVDELYLQASKKRGW